MIDWTSWMDYGFMKMALAAILIITPLFGLMGTMIVNKKMAYFSDALGHSALTGIAVGVVCGIPDTNISMVIFAVVFALLLNKIGSRSTVSTDTIISVFSSCSVAIGLAILSKGGNFSKYSSLLVGDVLSITKKEIGYLVIIFIVTILFWITCFNWLNAICIHRALAKSKRIPVQLMDYVFAVLVALIVMLALNRLCHTAKYVRSKIWYIADPSGGIEQKSVGKHAGIPCLFDNFFRFLGRHGADFVLLHERCNRPNDCNYRICDLFCDLFFRKKVERITGRIEFDRLYFL